MIPAYEAVQRFYDFYFARDTIAYWMGAKGEILTYERMRELVAAGLVEGASGKGGGYRLLRAPEEYTVWDIIGPMEGSLAAVACLAEGAPPCPRSGVCETLPLWAEYDRLTRSFFQSRRLSDLISGKAQ